MHISAWGYVAIIAACIWGAAGLLYCVHIYSKSGKL
jgi:hypothetical protein